MTLNSFFAAKLLWIVVTAAPLSDITSVNQHAWDGESVNLSLRVTFADHANGPKGELGKAALHAGTPKSLRPRSRLGINTLLAGPDIILQNSVNRSKSVFIIDLLTLSIGTTIIGDPHLIDYGATTSDFCCNFRFKTKTILDDCDALDQFALEHLITGFHIRQVDVGEHIGEHR